MVFNFLVFTYYRFILKVFYLPISSKVASFSQFTNKIIFTTLCMQSHAPPT